MLQIPVFLVAVETMKLDEITLVLFGEREFEFAGDAYPEFINYL
jgi:hypothetical protein